MNNTECDILIIGAGITGLSLASFLETNNYLIVDKDSEVGGYCKTTIRNGFVWDYSGHFFHFNNQEIKIQQIPKATAQHLQKDHPNYLILVYFLSFCKLI